MDVLVVNAGSSSLKLRLLAHDDELLASRDVDTTPDSDPDAVIAEALDGLGEPDAVGHRVVHGGTRFRDAVRVDDTVLAALEELTDLAPLHQPASLAALAAVRRALPGVPSVACFDTAFHATLPDAAATYAVPAAWRERWGLRRYGFHGLSHAYASRRAAELLGRPLDGLRLVTCHLGAGASLAAVRDGESVDTTMGFTPLAGLVMATRSGDVDPGLIVWLLERGLEPTELGNALERDSGLAALAGTGDMRAVLEGADAGEERATLALAVYVHRLRAGVASMAAALGGLDALVFTGGVGERSPVVRAAAAEDLGFLGVGLDLDANRAAGADADVSARGAAARVLVVAAREDLEIARQVRSVLAADPPAAPATTPEAPAEVNAERFDGVLFDLDGVLTSTADLHRACWKETFDGVLERWAAGHGEHQAPFDAVGDYARYVDGKPRDAGVRDFLAARGITLPEGALGDPPGDESVQAVGNAKQVLIERALASGGVQAFPGSVAWVRHLRDEGLRTAVVSSSENTAAVLDSAGITDLFDATVDGRTVRELGLRGKPAPDGFLEGARRLEVSPSRAVVIEDALAGVAAGRAGRFGLVIGVSRSATPEALLDAGADVVVHDLAEMLR